jgi:hypothetical protein
LTIYLASVLPNSLPAFQTLTLNSSDQPAVTGPDLIVAPTPAATNGTTTVMTVTVPVVNLVITPIAVSTVPVTIVGDQLSFQLISGGLLPVTLYEANSGLNYCNPNAPNITNGAKFVSPSVQQVSLTTASSGLGADSQIHASTTNDSANLIPLHTFNIEVDQAPSILSPATTYFSKGVNNDYYGTTSGFPEASPVTNSTSTATAMRVTLAGHLPAGVTFTDLSPEGLPTGTGHLSGTPTETGTFPATITANNRVGSPAVQQFTLVVNQAGDVNGDGVVNCADIAIVKAAFGSYLGQASYDPRADVNHDFAVNVLDLAFVAAHLPAGTTCR